VPTSNHVRYCALWGSNNHDRPDFAVVTAAGAADALRQLGDQRDGLGGQLFVDVIEGLAQPVELGAHGGGVVEAAEGAHARRVRSSL